MPAVAMYQVQMTQERIEQTEESINTATVSIGGFRSIFGRYPCPAPLTAAPGDAGYGLEARDAGTGNCIYTASACVNGICAASSNHASGGDGLIGSLPFKTLNLQEFESYDTYKRRIMYAVSNDLTNLATFDMGQGRISIEDKDGDSYVRPEHGAHFVVLSFGDGGEGAYTKAGVQTSVCPGAGSEAENCDMDATFISGQGDTNFDHILDFFSSVSTSEWQVSDIDDGDIHVRTASNIAIGTEITDDTGTTNDDLLVSESAAVRMKSSDDGSIRVRDRVLSATLCENEQALNPTVDCFSPNLVAGELVQASGVYIPTVADTDSDGVYDTRISNLGMSCGDQYLVGVQNGMPVCSDEIVMRCPAGNFLVGIDASGEVICDTQPQNCEDPEDVTSWCGETKTLPPTFEGGYSLTYSGDCYRITNYTETDFETMLAGMTYSEVQAEIEDINNQARTHEKCDTPDDYNSQIRETYQCVGGSYEHVVAHEKRYPWTSFPSNITYTGSSGGHVAEPNDYPYEDYGAGSLNPSGGGHDCWCREDYRVDQTECEGATTGMVTRVWKHRCPQNTNRFSLIYEDEANCACSTAPVIVNQSCTSYYNEVNGTNYPSGSLSGTVQLTYPVSCDTGTAVQGSTPTSVDTTDCECVPSGPSYSYDYCPSGTTNSFTWSWPGLGSRTATAVEGITIEEFVCPSTTTGGLPDPGSDVVSTYSGSIPACTCDDSITDEVTLPCPSNLEGEGYVFEREWVCGVGYGSWEPQEDWELMKDNCKSCSWQKPSGSPVFYEFSSAPYIGGSCDCSTSGAGLCKDDATGGYDVYSGCQCVAQTD